MDWFKIAYITFLSLAGSFAISFFLRHRQNQRKMEQESNETTDEILIGTLDDLEKAEKEVAEMNIEERLIETHQLVETFNTMHGFDTNYIEGLLRELAGEGINATYLFKQTMPTGTMSYTGHSGIFEVYVSKESVDQAQDYIQKKLGHK